MLSQFQEKCVRRSVNMNDADAKQHQKESLATFCCKQSHLGHEVEFLNHISPQNNINALYKSLLPVLSNVYERLFMCAAFISSKTVQPLFHQ